jgi:esterase/lipase superfamily enzyme
VILAAPDIDVDVFESQLRRFGKPQKPFFVVLSKDDRALALSKFIAGGESRLGADANLKELAAMGAVVIDLSQLQGQDSANHDKFAQLAQVAPQLAPILAQGIARTPGDAGSGLGTVVSKSLEVIGAPITIVQQQ